MPLPKQKVKEHINFAVNVAMQRVGERAEELFTSEIASTGNGTASPFHKLLLPEAKVFSSYERSLSASLGKAFDYIAAAIAQATYGNGQHDHRFSGNIAPEVLGTIEAIVTRYKKRVGSAPDTVRELEELAGVIGTHSASEERVVKSDVYFVDHEGYENYLEIKTAMPNYDQCSAMKTRILTIHAMRAGDEKVRALAVFPHNPNGLVGEYAWPPLRYFLDPAHDWFARGQKLMGPGLWTFIGNSPSTYEELLDCFYEVSVERKPELWDLLKLTGNAT